MEKFRKLGLSEEIIKALVEMKFTEPTEIQAKAIPYSLKGDDVIGGSATGSGKTLAFGANIIERIRRGDGIGALIITPTRELAEQVGKSIMAFSKYKPLHMAIVYGGVAIGPQVLELEKADVVVGTPGRILDHIERGTISLSKIKILVLDEADRMLDMGFIEDVSDIISKCPKERQTFLFSATINQDIAHIARRYMKNPIELSAENYVDPSKLEQVYYDVSNDIKFSLLVHFLKHEHKGLVMVFCNTRHNADFVAKNLQRNEIDAMAIHGGLTQARRNKIMEYFHQGRVFVLVCTDVAARGLDIKGVSHVYNYDIPVSDKDYIHRIGRTARAGKEGIAISIVSSRDYENFRNVLRNPELNIKQEKVPETLKRVGFVVHGGRNESRGFSGGRRFSGRGWGKESSGRRNKGREFQSRGGSGGGFSSRDRKSFGERSERAGFSDRRYSGRGFSRGRGARKSSERRW